MQKIICSACKHHELIILGVRHFDQRMREVMEELSISTKSPGWIQGFVDNKGDFLTREEALKVATDANQLIRKTQPEDQLFSEDLY